MKAVPVQPSDKNYDWDLHPREFSDDIEGYEDNIETDLDEDNDDPNSGDNVYDLPMEIGIEDEIGREYEAAGPTQLRCKRKLPSRYAGSEWDRS